MFYITIWLIARACFWFILSKFAKFHNIQCYAVNSIFMAGFSHSVCFFHIVEGSRFYEGMNVNLIIVKYLIDWIIWK